MNLRHPDMPEPKLSIQHGLYGGSLVREVHSPETLEDGRTVQAYLWARTVVCSDCLMLIPLSPNWRLSPAKGIRLSPDPDMGIVRYQVRPLGEASRGTVRQGIVTCPNPECGRAHPKDYVRRQFGATGHLGQVEYCEVYRELVPVMTRGGKWIQGRSRCRFRVPPQVELESVRERYRVITSWGPALVVRSLERDPTWRDLQGGDDGVSTLLDRFGRFE